jgi:hypothetical protein
MISDATEALRKHAKDITVKIKDVYEGSVILTVEGTEEGIERLRYLFLVGKISRILDFDAYLVDQEPVKAGVYRSASISDNAILNAITNKHRHAEDYFYSKYLSQAEKIVEIVHPNVLDTDFVPWLLQETFAVLQLNFRNASAREISETISRWASRSSGSNRENELPLINSNQFLFTPIMQDIIRRFPYGRYSYLRRYWNRFRGYYYDYWYSDFYSLNDDVLLSLAPLQREVLYLHYTLGLTYNDIANRIDIPISDVRAIIQRNSIYYSDLSQLYVFISIEDFNDVSDGGKNDPEKLVIDSISRDILNNIAFGRENSAALQSAFSRGIPTHNLSHQQQLALRLRVINNLSFTEIAQEMKITYSQASLIFAIALKKLKKHFEELDISD